MLAAKYESTLDQMRDHDHALGIGQHFFRNAFVRRVHDRTYNFNRRLQAFYSVARAVPKAYVPTMPTRLIKHKEIVFFINCSFQTCAAKRG
jgi:hypothetical protein